MQKKPLKKMTLFMLKTPIWTKQKNSVYKICNKKQTLFTIIHILPKLDKFLTLCILEEKYLHQGGDINFYA